MNCVNNSRKALLPVALFVLTVAVATAGASSPPRQRKCAKKLDDVIERIELTDGAETIGGASMHDAVFALRERACFPVAFEMIEFERPKDFVTLREALKQLHTIQAAGTLNARDKSRLDTYESMARTGEPSDVLVARQKAFRLVQNRIAVRRLLDRLMMLDDEYLWKNYGTESAPLIVIEPRAASALDWRVASICHPRPIASTELYAGCNNRPCGPFTKLLSEHNMTVSSLFEGPVAPGKQGPDLIPQVPIDACNDHFTARNILNLTVKGTHNSWTLAGIKGMRFVSFESSTH